MNTIVVIVSMVAATTLAAPQYAGDGSHRHLAAAPSYQGPPVVPVLLPGGFIADTEEVAKAKELHFNAFANAASKVKDSKYNSAYTENSAYAEEQPRYTAVASYSQQPLYTPVPAPAPVARQQDYNVPQHRYTGPVASTARYAAPAAPKAAPVAYQQTSYQQPAYSSQPRYQGPPVVPVVLANGYIAETADVEAAKEHHFQLYAAAQAAAARAQERAGAKKYAYTAPAAYNEEDDGSQYEEQDQRYNQVYQHQSAAQQGYSTPQKAQAPYRGPPVVPVVLPSGHIADTAEVAAAKISHLQQLLDAAQKSLPQQRYR